MEEIVILSESDELLRPAQFLESWESAERIVSHALRTARKETGHVLLPEQFLSTRCVTEAVPKHEGHERGER